MKLFLKPKAINLRKRGYSLSDIAGRLKIGESTASLWCRGIALTLDQEKALEVRTNRKLQKFFTLVAEQKKIREKQKERLIRYSQRKVGKLSERDRFIAGVALYWAEGFKHEAEKRIGFCNSEPEMMKFEIEFLEKCFGVLKSELSPRLTLNEAFKDRTEQIQNYWAEYLEIPPEQFTRPFYQKVKQIKVYNDSNNYHGVLRIHVRKSSGLMTQMRGSILGLKSNI